MEVREKCYKKWEVHGWSDLLPFALGHWDRERKEKPKLVNSG